MAPLDLRHPYLTRQLIAYIGNKRALLPFIHQVLEETIGNRGKRVLLDPFAGSGAVSRLARAMGFAVRTNDWEPYTRWINGCHIGTSRSELDLLFRDRGGLDTVLGVLNSLEGPAPGDRYISEVYAPSHTNGADYRTERLFYTAENALVIDAVRSRIEQWYPDAEIRGDERLLKEKKVLLASLLYQAATHTNTSGVFKAYHRGFGGHGADALGRILAPIQLLAPVVIDAPQPARVSCEPAERFVQAHTGDICYLDPPYNQHQYGSNYHLLNTIGLWDRPPVSREIGTDGRLKDKAGIRKDWTRTRSLFCSRDQAALALESLLGRLDCSLILLSYNTHGNVGPEDLLEILSRHGRVGVRTKDHVQYRGGRQSLGRRPHGAELLWIVDRRVQTGKADQDTVRRLLLRRRLLETAQGRFDPRAVSRLFRTEANNVWLAGKRSVPMPDHYRFESPDQVAQQVPPGQHARTLALLDRCLCRDRSHQAEVLIGLLDGDLTREDRQLYSKELLRQLRKLAHKKYGEIFAAHCRTVVERADIQPDRFGHLKASVEELKRLAAVRAAG